MQELKLSQIAGLFGVKLDYEAHVREIVTDTRKTTHGALFIAIKGETYNGNEFAKKALENGACAVVVSELCDGVDPARAILVPDTKRAFIRIGGLHRRMFDIPFVGVTGSVGKTTTKEFISAVLASKYNVHKTQGNQNNEIGVPHTLLSLNSHHEIGVIEMAMCGFGEIHDLTVEVRPAVGVITSIGVSHIEHLGSRENILKAKMELLDGMAEGSPLFLCGDNDLLSKVDEPRFKVYKYGITNKECQILAHDIKQIGDSTRFVITSPWGEYPAVIPVVGQHNVLDALAAFSVGCVTGVEPAAAAAAVSNYVPVGMRQNIVPCRGMTLVEDCYNCSPDSLRAAVLALAAYPCTGRRILVISDMLELGENAARMHEECGTFIARQDINILMGSGELTEYTIRGADKAGMERCCHYKSKEQMGQELLKAIRPNDVIWFKASRGMRLEDVIAMVIGKGEKA